MSTQSNKKQKQSVEDPVTLSSLFDRVAVLEATASAVKKNSNSMSTPVQQQIPHHRGRGKRPTESPYDDNYTDSVETSSMLTNSSHGDQFMHNNARLQRKNNSNASNKIYLNDAPPRDMIYPPTNNNYGAHNEPIFQQPFSNNISFPYNVGQTNTNMNPYPNLSAPNYGIGSGQYPQYGIGGPTMPSFNSGSNPIQNAYPTQTPINTQPPPVTPHPALPTTTDTISPESACIVSRFQRGEMTTEAFQNVMSVKQSLKDFRKGNN